MRSREFSFGAPNFLAFMSKAARQPRLVGQVTCGDVGMEHAVAVAKTLFPLMLERLQELCKTGKRKGWYEHWEARRHLFGFLTTRCSAEFLSLYINRHQEILDSVSQPGLMWQIRVPKWILAI